MYPSVHTTLHNKAIRLIKTLPDEKLSVLIQFADFLNNSSYAISVSQMDRSEIRKKRQQVSGCLKGELYIAPDFNETPDCFKENL